MVRVSSFLILFLLALSVSPVMAFDRVIVNSGDWKDVYSGMLFASLQETPSNFLVSQKHGAILLYSIPLTEQELLVVSSRTRPYVYGYESFLKSKGYGEAQELATRNANLDLAALLDGVTRFIVIDPAYGYNAISVAPYAAVSGSYVLFADRRSIDDVVDFLDTRDLDGLLVFGQVDREVKDALARFSPETLNKGDRFSNNLAIVDRYEQYADLKQVILTNGEFIESSLLSGDDPVVFIGKANVPDRVRTYIQGKEIDVGILIGNELIGTATFVRRQLGISVFVKFAQGARTPQGAIAQVEDLDRFPMPFYGVSLEIVSLVYNRATQSLEVTYRNPVELALFLKGTITITGGAEPIVLGDDEPLFLDKGAYKTIVYSADSDGNPLVLDEGMEYLAQLLTIYGEGPNALENALQAQLPIEFVTVRDEALINITGLYYDKAAGRFFVTIENVGPIDAYVRPELVNLFVNDEEVTVAADAVVLIKKGKSARIPVTIPMAEADFTANPSIRVRAYYGEREIALIKVTERTFSLEFGGGYGRYVTYALVAALLLFLLFFLGTKKKCGQCGHKNARGRKTCEKCGAKL